ncbi:MAG: response regulator transcription factor [Brachyspira sp.]|jgi:nitrate/nitrite response regulator protein|nr:response regulator transcription factor [Brachyspira sp.]
MRVKKAETSQTLTDREIITLQYLAKGYENKEIADTIFVSTHTVKAHVSAILRKLNARNRTHAVYIAMKLKIID